MNRLKMKIQKKKSKSERTSARGGEIYFFFFHFHITSIYFYYFRILCISQLFHPLFQVTLSCVTHKVASRVHRWYVRKHYNGSLLLEE